MSNFKQTRGQKAGLAQYEAKNNKAVLESTKKTKEGSKKVEEKPKETVDQANKPSEDNPTESGTEFVHVSEDTLKMKDDVVEKKEEEDLGMKNSKLNEVDKTTINKNSDANNNLNNSNLNNSLAETEIDPEEVSELRDDGNNLLDNEADSTINLPSNNSSLLPCNGFATIDLGKEAEKEEFNIILKSIASIEDNDEPNLGDLVNSLDTELSEKEETKNPPALQEDSESSESQKERISRKDAGKKSLQNMGVLTRSQSTNRYIDTPKTHMDLNGVILENPLTES